MKMEERKISEKGIYKRKKKQNYLDVSVSSTLKMELS